MTRFAAVLLLLLEIAAARTAAQTPRSSPLQPVGTSMHSWDAQSALASTLPMASLRPHGSSFPLHRTLLGSQDSITKRHKSPFLAWFLSWLVPGGGQGYNGQWAKAGLFFGGAVTGVVLVASDGGIPCDGGACDAGLALALISSLGSQIEAPITAGKINRQARETAGAHFTLTLGALRF
jgi:hypothetical protein